MWRPLWLASVAVLVAAPSVGEVVRGPGPASPRSVRVSTPVFSGDPAGRAVATAISLQIWQTLRLAPGQQSPLQGEVSWEPALAEPSFETAEAVGLERGAQVVVWGEAAALGDGVLVTAHAVLPRIEGARSFQGFGIALGVADAPAMLRLDIPRRRYDFAPITFSRAALARFTEIGGFPVYSSPTGGRVVGRLGAQSFRALGHAGSATQVVFDGKLGWIRLPELAQLDNEIALFVGGVVRVLRGDWEGAEELLGEVIARQRTPSEVAIDARLYRAIARFQRRAPGWKDDAESAVAMNPFLRSSAATLLALQAAHAQDLLPTAEGGRQARAVLSGTAERYRGLFAEDDPWLRTVEAFARVPPD